MPLTLSVSKQITRVFAYQFGRCFVLKITARISNMSVPLCHLDAGLIAGLIAVLRTFFLSSLFALGFG
jgi:hypothetical protein